MEAITILDGPIINTGCFFAPVSPCLVPLCSWFGAVTVAVAIAVAVAEAGGG
jgi:hypothetical protein